MTRCCIGGHGAIGDTERFSGSTFKPLNFRSRTRYLVQKSIYRISFFIQTFTIICDSQGVTQLLQTATPTTATATSNKGIYISRATGVATPKVLLPAGDYLIVPSTFAPLEASYAMKVYCSEQVAVNQV